MNVTHVRFTPAGANTFEANSGECPCSKAHGVHARPHRYRRASAHPSPT